MLFLGMLLRMEKDVVPSISPFLQYPSPAGGGLSSKIALRDSLAVKAILKARESLLSFTSLVKPDFESARHLELICQRLEALERGEVKRLMIFMPPRSGKSLLTSIMLPAWWLGKHPGHQIMSVSYSGDLAADWGRQVRNMVGGDTYQEVFPGTTLRPDSRAADRWHTTGGGVYTSAGITSGIAGWGAHLAIVDDPLSEQDAFSKASRERVWRWYPGGLRTRLMPGGRIVIMQTRWHDDDLSGKLLKEMKDNRDADRWEVLEIPAILDENSAKMLGLKKGDSYWPAWWPKENLYSTKNNMPSMQWNALYMQRPLPEGGGILKSKWFREWPKKLPPEVEIIVQSYDTAYSQKETASSSAVTTWGIWRDVDGVANAILLHAFSERMDYVDLRKKAVELYKRWEPDVLLVEKKASGQSLIQDLRRAGLPVREYIPDKDKVSRAYACQPLLEGGRVWIPGGKRFAEEVVRQCSAFPRSDNTDLVDSTVQAILFLHQSWNVHVPDDDTFDEVEKPEEKCYYW